ncbi:MAG: DUF115 domain-containing protein [Leptospira sp.]|nr:DUF115 domain-containing protein [Leptospira sp.]NCS95034.1 DUF115 domain-containing protein [Leptospira sp.]
MEGIRQGFKSLNLEFHYYSDQNQFTNAIDSFPITRTPNSTASVNRFYLFCHPYYKRQFPELCQTFEKKFQEFRENLGNIKKGINQNTIDHFSYRWTSNYFQNLLESDTFRILKPDQFSPKLPAVFVGASSILENQWESIRKYRNSIYLISSDTALKSILHLGIIPDAVISVDSSRGTHFHLMEKLPPGINIFTWLGGSRIQFYTRQNLYLFLTNHPLDQWTAQINRIPDNWILNNPSRNIAGLCISLARYLGFRSIYLAGFELKSQSDKTHVRGTGYESYGIPLLNRKKSLTSFYPRRVYSKEYTQKNSESMKAILSTKNIEVKILDDSSNQLSSLISDHGNNKFTSYYKSQLDYLEFPLPASLYLNSIAGQEISGISKQVVKRFQSQFLK